jgi:hypothetical protein
MAGRLHPPVAGEPRQKWRVSPRVQMTNDARAAMGERPERHLLGVGCHCPLAD